MDEVMRPVGNVEGTYAQSDSMFDIIVEGEHHIHRHAERVGVDADNRATYRVVEADDSVLPGLFVVSNGKMARLFSVFTR